ncbi:MAG TPA: hypothetical protein VGA20_04445 [Gemmatimonadales bacterium]|jgi:hypothetical protein
MSYDRAYMTDQITRLEDLAEGTRETIKESFPDDAIGTEEPTDEQFARWFELKIAEYPPLPITFPDGSQRYMSPWIAALPFVDGGLDLVKRYEQARPQSEG